jgi:ABC-type nitrate/sulfonate/bicarbonate transport system permease component
MAAARSRQRRWLLRAAPYVFTLAFFAIWEAACILLKVPAYFLPTPSATLAARMFTCCLPRLVKLRVSSW